MIHLLKSVLDTPEDRCSLIQRMQSELPLLQKWRFIKKLRELDPPYFMSDDWKEALKCLDSKKSDAKCGEICANQNILRAWLETISATDSEDVQDSLSSMVAIAGVRELADLAALRKDPPHDEQGEG